MRSHASLCSLWNLVGFILLMLLCMPVFAAGLVHSRPAAPPTASESVAKPAARSGAKLGVLATLNSKFIDGIAAIIDKDIITLRELDRAMHNASEDLHDQKIQIPLNLVLQQQVLEQLIMQQVQYHEAERMNIQVDDAQIDQSIQTIAQHNHISLKKMQAEVQKTGISWADYRRHLGNEMRLDQLHQRVVDSSIVISDVEIDAYLKEQAHQKDAKGSFSRLSAEPFSKIGQPASLTLGQILVLVPEGADLQTIAGLRKKTEELLTQLRGGANFSSVAAASSNGPEALQGGNMGVRPIDGWPELFLQAISNLEPGQISDIVQSGNGFHILKVLDRQSGSAVPALIPIRNFQKIAMPPGPMRVIQTHARHILIKTSVIMNDKQARQRLELLRQRIMQGKELFANVARHNSQDASASQGGDLGWLSPGDTVPPFEKAMASLQPQAISQPIQSPFGWHLIQVEARREQDMTDEYQRMQAREFLLKCHAKLVVDDWLQQLRERAYIDNRLEKLSQQQSTG